MEGSSLAKGDRGEVRTVTWIVIGISVLVIGAAALLIGRCPC